ncbi:MAG TPA: hypothetical protein VMU40_03070 [Steroidobacteraceae bacterium]|nr:hypothetical protein [Steroidobacteraceae bacterium]
MRYIESRRKDIGMIPARSPYLQADCARCCALCCVAPAFDAPQGFGYDKPAHVPCTQLLEDRCSIHGERAARGFPACETFDCHGAGQRVTQQLFGGKSWRTSPELARQMFDAYFKYRALHEVLVLLELAMPNALPADRALLQERFQSIDHLCDSGAALDPSVRTGEVRAQALEHVHLAMRRASGAS